MRLLRLALVALAATLMLSGCAARASYDTDNISDPPDPSRFEVNGPATDRLDAPRGKASWYGAALHGNTTASGEPFNMYDFSAAHKTLPFGTWVMVTRTDTKAWTIVRINDRGPFIAGRIIDLSWGAASEVDMVSDGVAPVQLEILRQR
jgi:rare lipoprotein A (peptidoglycan hydrolase)